MWIHWDTLGRHAEACVCKFKHWHEQPPTLTLSQNISDAYISTEAKCPRRFYAVADRNSGGGGERDQSARRYQSYV